MKTNISLIADHLEEIFKIRKRIERNFDLSLNHAIIYSTSTVFTEGGLYIAKGADLPKKTLLPDELAIISIGSAPPIYKQGKNDYIEITPGASLIDVLNEVQLAYDDFNRWIDEINRVIMENRPLQTLYDLGLIKTTNPIYCITNDYSLMAYSEYPDLVDEVNPYGEMEKRAELVNELKLDEDFSKIFKMRDPTLWIDDNYDFDTLYCNIVLDNIESGLVLIDGRSRPLKRSDSVIIKIIRDATEFILNHRVAGQIAGYRVLEDLLIQILNGSTVNTEQLEAEFIKLGWDTKAGFYCCLLHMDARDSSINNAVACAGQIERTIAFTYAFPFNDMVLVLFPSAQWENNAPFFASALAPILREGLYKAALSQRFTDIHELPLYCKQAKATLATGIRSESTDWLFYSDDYLLPYMLENSVGELSPKLLCHSKLIDLIRYDEENHVEYVKTLKAYVNNNCSQAECCRAMYLHRSTLLQRLSRIKDITKIDLNDEKTRLYLRMIFAVFDYYDK